MICSRVYQSIAYPIFYILSIKLNIGGPWVASKPYILTHNAVKNYVLMWNFIISLEIRFTNFTMKPNFCVLAKYTISYKWTHPNVTTFADIGGAFILQKSSIIVSSSIIQGPSTTLDFAIEAVSEILLSVTSSCKIFWEELRKSQGYTIKSAYNLAFPVLENQRTVYNGR